MALGRISPFAADFFRSLARASGEQFSTPDAMIFFDRVACSLGSSGVSSEALISKALRTLEHPDVKALVASRAPKIFEPFLGKAKLFPDVDMLSGSFLVGGAQGKLVLEKREKAFERGRLSSPQQYAYLPDTLGRWAAAKLFGSFLNDHGPLRPIQISSQSSHRVLLPLDCESMLVGAAVYVDGSSQDAFRHYQHQVWGGDPVALFRLASRVGGFLPQGLLLTCFTDNPEVAQSLYARLLKRDMGASQIDVHGGLVNVYSARSSATLSQYLPLIQGVFTGAIAGEIGERGGGGVALPLVAQPSARLVTEQDVPSAVVGDAGTQPSRAMIPHAPGAAVRLRKGQ